ncbi:unnamed protein product [Cylindrotheca closterium]|uniref:Kinesin light chain n=1 Tax=Cylindrotheca closterium TaxID=2856 RepID=A0AAD2FQU7_9STRA|nr:unnamed protein product [Cylindrotheca closterium]
MSVLMNFGHSNVVHANENSSYHQKRSSPFPPKSPDSVATANPGRTMPRKKDRKVLQERSTGATNQARSPIPPRPLSLRSSRSKERRKRDSTRKSKPSIWRFDVNEEEEKKEDSHMSTCRVLLTRHSFSPELSGPSQHFQWQLPTQKSHRRAQSWDAGDHSVCLSSNQYVNSGEEQKYNGSDDACRQNLNPTTTSGGHVQEPSYQENNARPRSDQSRETFQQLRYAIRMARNKAMMENCWANYQILAQLLRRLAGLYFEQEEVFAAQATLEDALEMYQHVLACTSGNGKDSCLMEIADIICNLGSIELQHKNFELAIARFTEALDLQAGILGGKHPKVIASLDNLGYSLSKCKSYNQALFSYTDMLNAQLLHYETFNAECYETLGKQLLMYEKLNDWKGATKAVKRALEKALNVTKVSNEYIEKLQRLRSELKAKSNLSRR